MPRLVGSKIRNPDRLEPIKGIKEIIKIAEKLKLPYWWVESVIIEYLPCRRFVENRKICTFDFEIFNDALINTIGQYRVIIPSGSRLIQNISTEDFAFRTPQLLVGNYAEPLDQAN